MPQGFARFQCIGGACEITCCSHWIVYIDQAHYKILKDRLGGCRADREVFKTGVTRDKTGGAQMRLRPDGACAFLAEDGYCSLQRRFGEEVLPYVCVTYPRCAKAVGSRYEMSGALSCPEMVRRCLLADDGMKVVETSELKFPRDVVPRPPSATPRPYERHLNGMRAVVLDLLSRRQYPIRSRLFFVAYLGKRTQDFFYRDAAVIDEPRLAAEVQRMQTPAVLDDLDRGFRSLAVPGQVAANIVLGLLKARLDQQAQSGTIMVPLVTRVLEALGASYNSADGADLLGGDVTALWTRCQAQQKIWENSFADRIDLIFENHAKSYWFQELYTDSPNLLVHAQNYICRAAAARFLVFGHPALQAAALLADPDAKLRALDQAVVEVVSKLARAIEHDRKFRAKLQAALAEGGLQDFAHTTILARA